MQHHLLRRLRREPGRAVSLHPPAILVALASLLCALASGLAPAQDKPRDTTPAPAAFAAVKAAPADLRHLSPIFTVNKEEDEGGEMPDTIDYYQTGSHDYGTFMSVTDLSLCRRSAQRATCKSFRKMISAAPPPLGAEVTATRIGGSGYATFYLARVDGVKLAGVDAVTAFLGGDTQDPPAGSVHLYIYAQRGSNLIQMTTGVGRCTAPPRPNEKDAAYYRRACANPSVLAKASAAGKRLVELFRLAP